MTCKASMMEKIFTTLLRHKVRQMQAWSDLLREIAEMGRQPSKGGKGNG